MVARVLARPSCCISSSSIRPISPQDKTAEFGKVEVLAGEAKQRTGFTTADAVK